MLISSSYDMTMKANKYINALEIDNYVLFYTTVTGAVSIDGHRLLVPAVRMFL